MQDSSDNNFPQNRSGNRRRSRRRRPVARPRRQVHPKKSELLTKLQRIKTKMLELAEEENKLAQGFVSSAPQFQHLVTPVDTKCLLSAGNELQFLAKDEAAYYLFLLWQINYGRDVDYDLGKGFEQFKRDVSKFTRKHTSRGRNESERVREARQMAREGKSYRDICEHQIPDWDKWEKDDQETEVRRLGDAVRKSKRRARKKSDKS